jgi:hypothetical protein
MARAESHSATRVHHDRVRTQFGLLVRGRAHERTDDRAR